LIDLERKAYIFDKLGYKPHSTRQQSIHDSQARIRILCCGRRYGKTTFGANELTAALVDPEQAGYYWIVGPKYTTAEKEFRIVYFNILKKLGLGGQIKKSYNVKQGDMRIEIPRIGSLLETKSAQHKDTLLGEGLAGVIMAEAARHDSDTWTEYVRPALSDVRSDGTRGWAIFSSTPQGFNWFQGLWALGQRPGGSYESWRLPSWENPIVYPGGRNDAEILEMEEAMKNRPGKFDQEIGAEFTAFSGKIYANFSRDIHVRSTEYNPRWTNVWALDYGWSNPFVCLDVMIDPEDNFYVWREYQQSEMTTFEHAQYLKRRESPPDYHVDWAAGDPRGPDQANTIAMACHLDVMSHDIGEGNTHDSWDLGVDHVSRLLKIQDGEGKPKLFIDPSCGELIRQMEQLRHIEDDPETKNPREGQHKHDDHGPDALRYLVGQYFETGAGSALSEVYSSGQQRSEAATFFQRESHLDRFARF
jgi:hypothetical protein